MTVQFCKETETTIIMHEKVHYNVVHKKRKKGRKEKKREKLFSYMIMTCLISPSICLIYVYPRRQKIYCMQNIILGPRYRKVLTPNLKYVPACLRLNFHWRETKHKQTNDQICHLSIFYHLKIIYEKAINVKKQHRQGKREQQER